MIYVIEVHNKTTNKYSYMAHDDRSGGYPWFTNGMFTATRFKTFEQARNEYQRMVSAPNLKMSDGSFCLPTELRSAAEINGRTVTDAVLTVSILEVSGATWPEIKVNRLVNHTVTLLEKEHQETKVTVE